MKKIGIILLSLLVVSGLLATEKPFKCPKNVPVMTETLAGQVFVERVTFTGALQPETVRVLAKIEGTVTSLMVGEGDLVSADFQMVELNDGLKGEKAAFEKELDIWQKRLKARQGWKERNPRAEAQAEEQIKRIEGQLAQLQQQALESLLYTASLSGRISGLAVALGQQVKAGDLLLTVVNSKKKIARIKTTGDMSALFTQDSYELTVGTARLQAVKLGEEDGCVLLAVEDESLAVSEGSAFSLTCVKQTHRDAVVVAESILFEQAGKTYVYVLEGNISRLRPVTVQAREESKALISSGLALGEELIVAEIADAKKALLRESFPCLKDGGQVAVMVMNQAKDRLIKRPKTAQASIHQATKQDLPKEVVKAEQKPAEEVKKKSVVKKKKAEKVALPAAEKMDKPMRLALGVRAGTLTSSYSYELADGAGYTIEPKSKMTIGFAGMFEYALTKDISLGAEVASLAKDSIFQLSVGNKTYDLENKKQYLELSIYGKYHLPLRIDQAGKARPFLMLGFFYGQKGQGSWQYVYNDDEILTEDDTGQTWGKIDSGLLGGLGLDYAFSPAFSLLFDARYNFGFRDLKGNQVNEEIKFKGLQLSLGGLFRF